MLNCVCKYVATFFLIGKLPAPGTLASALVIVIYSLLLNSISAIEKIWFGISCSFVFFLLGWFASSVYARHLGESDPSEIVIDEVAGQFLALTLLQILAFLSRCDLSQTVCFFCFSIFRMLDIVKPWPIYWVESRVKGGLGIMLDDSIAALISAPIVFFGAKLIKSSTACFTMLK